jgi:hypothetical protein
MKNPTYLYSVKGRLQANDAARNDRHTLISRLLGMANYLPTNNLRRLVAAVDRRLVRARRAFDKREGVSS